LQEFSSPLEAFEKKGRLKGVKLTQEVIESLTNYINRGNDERSSSDGADDTGNSGHPYRYNNSGGPDFTGSIY
jgi:hypothetical protein